MATRLRFRSEAWARISSLVDNFFFQPASAQPLAALRISISALLLWQAFLLKNSFFDFFAGNGFVQKQVTATLNDPMVPGLDWIIAIFLRMGMSEYTALTSLALLYITSLIFLFAGYFTRISAIFAWLLHWSFTNTGYSGVYGADMYAHIFLFYLAFIPCGHAFSLDCYFNRVSGQASSYARLSLRVLQLHMCISYLASGLEKASGEQWWNGEIIWRALNTPTYYFADFHWLANVPFIPIIGGWAVLAIEIFYCVMIWPKKIRPWWIFATCLLHLGIAIFLRLPVFGLLMCFPTIALFAFSNAPKDKNQVKNKAWKARLQRAPI